MSALRCYRCGTDQRNGALVCWRKGCRCTAFFRGTRPSLALFMSEVKAPAEGYGTPARPLYRRIRRVIG